MTAAPTASLPTATSLGDLRRRPLLVSSRLPYDPDVPGHAPGGVTRCLLPFARRHGARWVGLAAGTRSWTADHDGVEYHGVGLEPEVRRGALDGFANSTLWPLLHGSPRPPVIDPTWWPSYVTLGTAVARRVAEVAPVGGEVWVHDYQLLLVPTLLGHKRPDLTVRFFLHTPFPAPDDLGGLPEAGDLLDGIAAAHAVGVQDRASAANLRAALAGRPVPPVAVVPVPADAHDIAALARTPALRHAARALRQRLGSPRTLLLGIDRLDYTKGVDLRLLALEHLLVTGRLDPATTRLLQISPTGRLDAAHYREERARVHHLVDRINERWGTEGPVVVLEERTYDRDETVAAMAAADVLLVTSRADGMNLVAKEFAAARADGTGALVLSRRAGAAAQLRAAHLVEPRVEDIARGLDRAVHAGAVERRRRMRALRAVVLGEDPLAWAEACTGTGLDIAARPAS
jgi:trehalose 6-phosphate synthase